jgi:hypothetical protein
MALRRARPDYTACPDISQIKRVSRPNCKWSFAADARREAGGNGLPKREHDAAGAHSVLLRELFAQLGWLTNDLNSPTVVRMPANAALSFCFIGPSRIASTLAVSDWAWVAKSLTSSVRGWASVAAGFMPIMHFSGMEAVNSIFITFDVRDKEEVRSRRSNVTGARPRAPRHAICRFVVDPLRETSLFPLKCSR